MFIDTHCHLFNEYYINIDEVIKDLGNNIAIVSATNLNNAKEVIYLINKYPNIYGTVGIHPEEIDNAVSEDLEKLEVYLKHPKVVGIGEIGLDYHYTVSNKERQKDFFIKQLQLAEKHDKMVVIHSRDALDDTYDILKNHSSLKINMHAFSGNLEEALNYINLGCKLGVGGIITFKNNDKLLKIIKNVDLHNIILETDSPFLTPVPFRGHQNKPDNVIYIAEKIAQIRNISKEEVIFITTKAALKQFDLKL
ncbi:MAG: TatD family hydrolase [Bacilli bacterium]|nr:TatD family hydrolase [Bacilli bacterium]